MKKKKLPEELKTVVDFPVFKYTVNVTFCWDVVKSRTRRDKFFGRAYDMGAAAALHSTKAGDGFNSWLHFHYDGTIESIVHESVHVIDTMFKTCGVGEDTETRAYHTGYLVNEIMKFVHKTSRAV
jgi:hypothetical protein